MNLKKRKKERERNLRTTNEQREKKKEWEQIPEREMSVQFVHTEKINKNKTYIQNKTPISEILWTLMLAENPRKNPFGDCTQSKIKDSKTINKGMYDFFFS